VTSLGDWLGSSQSERCTELLNCTDPATWPTACRQAARVLASGGLVVLPTDTVYGLAVNPAKPGAVADLLAAKGRHRAKPSPVLISQLDQLAVLAKPLSPIASRLAKAFWPGPLTMVLPVAADLEWDLGDTSGTIAVRLPQHQLCRTLIDLTGPLAVSSANLTGQPETVTAEQAFAQLKNRVDLVLEAGPAPGGQASTVVDLANPEQPRLLRAGAISQAELGWETNGGANQ
jgi:tRNA threonylcarbamoyl adenosine modification protein (Sua5/YciO/YrdC/YwlC family)